MTSREDFVNHFIAAEGVIIRDPEYPDVKVVIALIGSIYDLQQQIAQKDEFIDYLDQRLISLEQEVYK